MKVHVRCALYSAVDGHVLVRATFLFLAQLCKMYLPWRCVHSEYLVGWTAASLPWGVGGGSGGGGRRAVHTAR